MKKNTLNYAATICLLLAMYSCKKEKDDIDPKTPEEVTSAKQHTLVDLKGTPVNAYYRGEPVTVEKIDEDTYVLHGDIVLSKNDITLEGEPVVESTVQGNLWPNRVVYYSFNANATTKLRSDWNTAMTKFTAQGFQFAQATTGAFVEVQENTAGNGYSTSLGRSGSKQIISIDSKVFGVGAIAHEIGHAIGLDHEQQRPDRNLYMNVGNPSAGSWSIASNSFGVGTMDYGSIMMYPAYTGSATKKDGSTWSVQLENLSAGDIAGINYWYGKSTHIATGTYEIKSQKNTANNLHIASGNVTSNTDNSSSNQRWQFTHVSDGYYKIINVANGQALDAWGSGTTSGSDVSSYSYGGGNNQLWQVVPGHVSGTYRIHPKHAKTLCLGLNGTSTASGTEVRIYSMTLDGGQLWRLQKQ